MTQDSVQATSPKRKWYQFGLRTLFVLMLICCPVILAIKCRHEANVARKKQWLLTHGGTNAVPLFDGDVVLVRDRKSCGALIVKAQNMQPERMEYDWHYRSDGSGMVFADDAAVSSGSGLSDTPSTTNNVHFGPFNLQWSGSDQGVGWLYYPHESSVEFCVVRERPLRNIDAMSEELQFKLAKDKPLTAPR